MTTFGPVTDPGAAPGPAPPSSRRVHRLRLAGPSREQALRLLPTLDDALRCASLPGDGAELWVVRRLALGRLRPDTSAGALSRRIEQLLADGAAVPADSPAAADASAVVFAGALDARVRLALRLLQRAPCRQWYWPLAVPEFDPARGLDHHLLQIAAEVAGWPEARVALPAWVAPLLRAGAGPALARAIPPAHGLALLQRAGVPMTAVAAAPGTGPLWPLAAAVAGAAERRASEPPLASGATTGPAALAWRMPDWLAALAHAAGLPTDDRWTVPPTPGHRSGAGLAAGRPAQTGRPLPAGGEPAPRSVSAPRPGASPPDAGAARPPAAQFVRDEPQPARAEQAPRPPTGRSAREAADALLPLDPRPWSQSTAAGGLLFLLPVLARIGLPGWLDGDDNPPAFVAAVLRAALQRLELPASDPAWALASSWPAGALRPAVDRLAPACWRAPPLRPTQRLPDLAAALHAAPDLDAPAETGLHAARRGRRRAGGIGLASLVLRPATIALTPSHADLRFRLADGDLRVRRQGLDIDPGWLPWFGRVVAFHYSAGPPR